MKNPWITLSLVLLYFLPCRAQDSTKWYNRLKLDGYIQMQFAMTDKLDSVSLNSESAGRFDRFVSNKFMLRRSRIQMFYKDSIAESSISFDINERGVQIKDSWLKLRDPWTKTFTLTSGIFSRPFGEEIELSSRDRELPERSMVIHHLFPGIRDLGVNLRIQAPNASKWHFLKLDLGIYHGTSGNLESDKFKDYSGRLVLENPFKVKNLDYHFGYSGYLGKVNHLYDIDGSGANYRFVWNTKDTTFMLDGVSQTFTIMNQDIGFSSLQTILNDPNNRIVQGTYSTSVDRIYHSFHGQIKYKSPFGKLVLRGEYLMGQQVSVEGTLGNPYVFTSQSPTGPFTGVTWPKFDSPQPYNAAVVGPSSKPYHTFLRNFCGYYVYLDQQIGKSKHFLSYRLDYYDPNVDVEGKDILLNIEDINGQIVGSTGLSVADVAFMNHVVGYRFEATKNLTFSVYLEIPKNEITNLIPLDSDQIGLGKYPHPGFLKDVKDHVLLIRLQYKFS
ncbi:MAG: hypothetical protein EB023_07955 [Flavobacteriia bacterium]|nr:hypothetical protein [Flavobacteriia bacterium]